MAILFGGSGNRVNSTTPPATSLRIQTSLNGVPIAIVHGRQRLTGNLIDYVGFASTTSGGNSGGGKGGVFGGGGKGASGGTTTTYSVGAMFGLCEGPIEAIGLLWASQNITTPGKAGLGTFEGTSGQASWGYLTAHYPNHALGYSWLGYTAGYISLGTQSTLNNDSFEVTSAIAGAVRETCMIASPFTFGAAYFSLAASVIEQVTVPPTSPYQIAAQTPGAGTSLPVVSGAIVGGSIPGSASQGVIDQSGRVFARVSGSPATGQYAITAAGRYTFATADAGLQVTLIDLAIAPGVNYCYQPTGNLAVGSAVVSGLSAITGLAIGQRVHADGIPPGTVVTSLGTGSVNLSQAATADAAGASLTFVGAALQQVLGTPAAGQFRVSVQPGAYGQYLFAAADNGKSVLIVDVPDANPADSLTDFLSNRRYGCGFPAANIGDLTQLDAYALSAGLFISPALNTAQAANSYLNDFATGLNGEFVWSAGLLTFVPYGDTPISGNGGSYTPPNAPIYTLGDDDFLKNEGTQSIGVSAFTSGDPVVCVRTRPSDAYNDVKIEYLDRGNSYNPTIVEAKDDAAINAYGLRPQDSKQLHFFCNEAAALMSAQLQLGRQQVRNLYSFTVPWYFILLDPMDIIAISDAALGLANQWVRITEITENQEDGTLTISAEEYLQGTGWAPGYATQPRGGATPNTAAAPSSVN